MRAASLLSSLRSSRCALAALTLALAGCGGGGGGGGSGSAAGTQAAQLSLSVSGLPSGQTVALVAGSQTLDVSSNGVHAFAQSVPMSGTLSIGSQPAGSSCLLLVGGQAGTSFALSSAMASGVSVYCSSYPAFTPTLPQVSAPAGTTARVLSSPVVTPVFYADDPVAAQSQQLAFLQVLVQSSLWRTLQQYGVGNAAVRPPVVLSTNAGSPYTLAQAVNDVATHAAAWAGGTLTPQQFFVLYVPHGTVLDVAGAAAYHSDTYVNGTLVSFAVVPLPASAQDQIATEHELLEGSADPDGSSGYSTVPDAALWSLLSRNSSTEIGDMCELYTTSESDLAGYVLQPIWSNAAAAALADPCVPQADMSMFGAVPSLPATLSGAQGQVPGVVVPPGSSVTVPVRLFATTPAVGIEYVSADMAGYYSSAANASGWSLHLDKSSGLNGQTLDLTITAPATAAPGLFVFELIAADTSGRIQRWPGAVANSANY